MTQYWVNQLTSTLSETKSTPEILNVWLAHVFVVCQYISCRHAYSLNWNFENDIHKYMYFTVTQKGT